MKPGSIMVPLCFALLFVFVPVKAQADVHPSPTTFVCPATISIGAIGDKASAGWTSPSNTNATFKKAEVIESVGLAPPQLTCEYAAGIGNGDARLVRPEPSGMLCSVNTVKSSQFDCFPRPGTQSSPVTP